MVSRSQVVLRATAALLLAALSASPAYSDSIRPRKDVGVAAVDTRTGAVLWEAWRSEEIPDRTPDAERLAVDYLLALENPRIVPPLAPLLPDFPVKELVIKNPWPEYKFDQGRFASEGKTLIYYRAGAGVIAFDRKTKKEAWRLETTRSPYPSVVLEAGENRAFIQIGSDVPLTINAVLVGGGQSYLTMSRLEPHTLKQRAAAAVLLHHYGDGYLRPEIRKLIGLLGEDKTDPAAEEGATALEKLLADWPKRRDRQRLLDGCVAALLGAEEGNPFKDFSWPGTNRVLAWCLLQELIYGRSVDGYTRQGFNYAYHGGWEELPISLPEATRAKLAEHCRKVVAEGPDAEKPFAASVLVSTSIGWNRLSDAERKKLFLSSDPSAWRWMALALSKNGKRKELMEWARERPADDLLDVVWLLNRDKPKEWSEVELALWLACARHNPGGVAYVLRGSDDAAPKEFREPIRAGLEREIAKPTVKDGGTQPAYNLHAMLTVLDRWQNPDDTALLQTYLTHPLHSSLTRSPGGTVIRQYGLRLLVKGLLQQRGVKVPPDVVYEEEIEQNWEGGQQSDRPGGASSSG
jgi:hypothetical protein